MRVLPTEARRAGFFGEDSPYTNSVGQTIQGTRAGQGPDYGENTSDSSIANANDNALEAILRYQHHGSQFLLSSAKLFP